MGVALGGGEAGFANHGLHFLDGGADVVAGFLHDVFVEEGAAEVVGAEVEGDLASLSCPR